VKRLAALVLLCGILALNSGTAQERKTAPTEKTERAHFAVRNTDPVVLAEVVGVHFKGEATLVATPAGSGNTILVSGSAAAVPEVMKLLELLDRRPRSVEVEVAIVEVTAGKDGKLPEVKPEELKGGQRIRLTAVEGQQVSSQIGGNKPYTSGSVIAGGGGGFGKGGGVAQRSISYQPVGTTVKMTARVGTDNAVSLELNVQDNKVKAADAGDEVGAPTMEHNTLTTRLSVPAGRPVIAQSVRSEGKGGPTVSLVVVTARVVDDRGAMSGAPPGQ
jgi:type II secretory pathway component GspD/PulD (secretin)